MSKNSHKKKNSSNSLLSIINFFCPHSKAIKADDKRKIVTRGDGISEQVLIDAAVYHYAAAEVLFESRKPFTYFSAGYILQLVIELMLKALCLNQNNEYIATHKLRDLLKCIKDCQLSGEDLVLINELDIMYELRYPIISSNTIRKVKDSEGTNRYRDEVGYDDLGKGIKIINKILAHLPNNFSEHYKMRLQGARYKMP